MLEISKELLEEEEPFEGRTFRDVVETKASLSVGVLLFSSLASLFIRGLGCSSSTLNSKKRGTLQRADMTTMDPTASLALGIESKLEAARGLHTAIHLSTDTAIVSHTVDI